MACPSTVSLKLAITGMRRLESFLKFATRPPQSDLRPITGMSHSTICGLGLMQGSTSGTVAKDEFIIFRIYLDKLSNYIPHTGVSHDSSNTIRNMPSTFGEADLNDFPVLADLPQATAVNSHDPVVATDLSNDALRRSHIQCENCSKTFNKRMHYKYESVSSTRRYCV